MEISNSDVLKELERLRHDFEESKVNVKCLVTKEEFDIGGKKIKIREGATLQLPFWIAYILYQEKLVEFDFSVKMDFPSLYRLSDKEQNAVNLQKIDPFFYIIAMKTFNEFKEKNSISYRQLEAIELKLRELMTLRLSKIIKIAEKGKNITSTTRNMTVEEKWLYEIVADAVEKWKGMVKEEK
ncbi:MAG: hypothetical protein ACTSQE_07650 [Candidatus Heimdallarchaeaceae archaeon]